MSQTTAVTLVPVTGEKSLAAFIIAEERQPDGWPAAAVESYSGHLVMGAVRAPDGVLDWVGCVAYRTLADIGWTIVDLVRGQEPEFFTLVGRRLTTARHAKRVGLLLPEGHVGIAPLEALGFTAVSPGEACEKIVRPPHLLPSTGQVRMVWNIASPS